MGETKIEWTSIFFPDGHLSPGYTFNTWHGCLKVSPACANCYAERESKAYGWGHVWGAITERRYLSEDYWKQPAKWNKKAQKAGHPALVFSNSMSDLFEKHRDTLFNGRMDQIRERFWAMISDTPWLIYLLLTKRPENILEMVPESWRRQFPPNVWVGTSVESGEYSWRLNELQKVNAPVLFVSVEPMLGKVDLRRYLMPEKYAPVVQSFVVDESGLAPEAPVRRALNWVICGSESRGAAMPGRFTSDDWIVDLIDQCREADTPFFLKQLAMDGKLVKMPKFAGRVWDELPQLAFTYRPE